MRGLKLILFFLAAILIFIVLWQNVPPLLGNTIELVFRIDYLNIDMATRPIPVLFLVPLFFFAGLTLMYLMNWGNMFQLRRRVKRLEKELQTYRPEPEGVSGQTVQLPPSERGERAADD